MPPNILDPLGWGAARQTKRLAPLTREEEDSILGRLLSGVAWVGETIDKPFAATRGLLAGDVEQLLHAVPFSDTLGFSPKKKYSGRDLLEMYGIAPRNRPGLDPWDVAGFGVDMLAGPPIPVLGPLTAAGRALRGGSKMARATKDLGKATKLAKEAMETATAHGGGRPGGLMGLTPASIGQEIREGLRAPIGLSLPWPLNTLTGIKDPLVTFGHRSEKVRGATATLWDLAHYGKYSPIRPLRQLISPELRGLAGIAHKERDIAYSHMRNANAILADLLPSQRLVYEDLMVKYGELAKFADIAGDTSGGVNFKEAASFIAQERSKVEGLTHMSAGEIAKMFSIPGDMPEMAAKVEQFSGKFAELLDSSMASMMDDVHGRLIKLGANTSDLKDIYSAYFPRIIDNPRAAEAAARMFSTESGHFIRRLEALRDVPEGRMTLTRLATDWRITQVPRVGVKDERGAANAAQWLTKHGLEAPPGALTENWMKGLQEKGMREWLEARGLEVPKGLDELREAYITEQWLIPAYTRSMVGKTPEQQGKLLKALTKGFKKGETDVHDRLMNADYPSKVSQLSTYFAGVRTGGSHFNRTMLADFTNYMTSNMETLANFQTIHAFLDGAVGMADDVDSVPLSAVWARVRNKAGKPTLTDQGLDTFLENYAAKRGIELTDNLANDLMVPQHAQKVLQTTMDVMDPRSDASYALTKGWDMYMSAWRAGVTIPFPTFHARNAQTGLWQNLSADAPYSARQLGRAYLDFKNWAFGKGKGSLEYFDEIEDIGLLREGRLHDLLSPERAEEMLAKGLPEGGVPEMFGEFMATPKTVNPLRFRGGPGFKAGDPQFAPFEVGDKLYGIVEAGNRIPPYIAARRAGYSPSQAKHLVDTIQYQYSHLSPFERRTMRRFVMPFYSWTRRNLPYQFRQLFLNPIGPSPTTVRTISSIQAQSPDYMPSWVRERMGLQLPTDPDQREKTYIRQFGLPFDEMADFSTSPKRTAKRLLSKAAPGLTLAYKLLFDEDPYTGRDLKTIRPGLTGIPTLDAVGKMLPLGPRAMAEFVRKPLRVKEGKYWTLLDMTTGVKVSDYDSEKWKALEMERAQREMLEDHPEVREYVIPYIPKDQQEANPEAVEDLKVLQLLIQAKKAAAAAQAKPSR